MDQLLFLLALLIAPLLIGGVAGKALGGALGKVVGAGIPVIGWGIYMVNAISGPSDYGLNQTLGPMLTVVVCVIVGFLGGLMAFTFDRHRRTGASGSPPSGNG